MMQDSNAKMRRHWLWTELPKDVGAEGQVLSVRGVWGMLVSGGYG